MLFHEFKFDYEKEKVLEQIDFTGWKKLKFFNVNAKNHSITNLLMPVNLEKLRFFMHPEPLQASQSLATNTIAEEDKIVISIAKVEQIMKNIIDQFKGPRFDIKKEDDDLTFDLKFEGHTIYWPELSQNQIDSILNANFN